MTHFNYAMVKLFRHAHIVTNNSYQPLAVIIPAEAGLEESCATHVMGEDAVSDPESIFRVEG